MKKSNHWKLLADLNISIKTVEFLKSLGVDIIRVDKSISTDEEIVVLAQKQNRTILTFDKDFGEIYFFHKNKDFTVIVLALENQTYESVNKYLKSLFEKVEYRSIKYKLLIVYEGRYRMIG